MGAQGAGGREGKGQSETGEAQNQALEVRHAVLVGICRHGRSMHITGAANGSEAEHS